MIYLEKLTELVFVKVEGMGHGDEYVRVRIMVRLESGKVMHTLANQCLPKNKGLKLGLAVWICGIWMDRAIGVRRKCGYPPLKYPAHCESKEPWSIEAHAAETDVLKGL
jgi:hypothetical protein